MRNRWFLLFVTIGLVGGCATSGSTGDPSGSTRQSAKTSDDSIELSDAHGPQPIPVDDAAPTEIEEENYPSGPLWKRVEGKRAKDGTFVPHGLTTTWYESGQKWTETTFRNGVQHGERRTWFTTGVEWSIGSYDNGVENGTWTAFHHNGEKAREWRLDHGVWNGPYKEWHPNGRTRLEVTFVDGLRQGVMRFYDEEGREQPGTDFIDGVEQP